MPSVAEAGFRFTPHYAVKNKPGGGRGAVPMRGAYRGRGNALRYGKACALGSTRRGSVVRRLTPRNLDIDRAVSRLRQGALEAWLTARLFELDEARRVRPLVVRQLHGGIRPKARDSDDAW